MDILLNPNVAYLVVVATFLLAFLAILVPGTGLLEILTLFAALFTGFIAMQLPVNWFAIVILLLAIVPFFLSVRQAGKAYFLPLSILAMVIGSAYFFRGEGWLPAVNPLVALVVSTLTAAFLWLVSRKTIEAFTHPPAHNLTRLIGQVGQATTDILDEGSVQLESELWSATSTERIPAGSRVRVIGREGLTLQVEKD